MTIIFVLYCGKWPNIDKQQRFNPSALPLQHRHRILPWYERMSLADRQLKLPFVKCSGCDCVTICESWWDGGMGKYGPSIGLCLQCVRCAMLVCYVQLSNIVPRTDNGKQCTNEDISLASNKKRLNVSQIFRFVIPHATAQHQVAQQKSLLFHRFSPPRKASQVSVKKWLHYQPEGGLYSPSAEPDQSLLAILHWHISRDKICTPSKKNSTLLRHTK